MSLSSATAYVEGLLFGPQNETSTACTLIGLRESSTGKSIVFAITGFADFNYGLTCSVQSYASNSRSGQVVTFNAPGNGAIFARVRRSGANVIVETSSGLTSWTQLWSGATASYFTSAPDQAMFGTMAETTNATMAARLLSFKYGSL